MVDERIRRYRDAALAMKDGRFEVDIPTAGEDEVARLGEALRQLGASMESKFSEMKKLSKATEEINSGLVLDDVLNHVYESFKGIIPFDRIGLSLIDEDGRRIRARWARSEAPLMYIVKDYSQPLEGSSLKRIIETGEPRILNDLETYLRDHPKSDSTKRIVAEGIRSSLTCPLIAMGKRIGVMFFSSMKADTYRDLHTELFLEIAGQLSLIVEKGRLYQELLELNELKNKFLGMAVHDLRNPLSSIKMSAEMMRDGDFGPVGESMEEGLRIIEQSCSGMVTLLEDLVDVNAIESGHLSLNREPVNLPDFLESCINLNRHTARKKSIEIKLNIEGQVPDPVMDPERMKQVMFNLISNAIKYSNPESDILVQASNCGKEVQVSVVDHGQGIAEEEISKLFKAYSRTSARPTAGEKSTGLGLAIVKRIVEAHGGRVWCTSKLGQGSTFYFTIPVAGLETSERIK